MYFTIIFSFYGGMFYFSGPGNVVGIATTYGLDGRGI